MNRPISLGLDLNAAPGKLTDIQLVRRGHRELGEIGLCSAHGTSAADNVTRARRRLRFRRVRSLPNDRPAGVICDQLITLTVFYSKQGYPKPLRRIRFKDPDSGKTLVLLTNHLGLPALTICSLYQLRWQVELFFKWIKQHLRIKAFYGTSENAVKTQIWIAV